MTAAASTTRRRPRDILVLLFGYENITRKVKNFVIVILILKKSLNSLQFTRNPAIEMAADCVDAPRRNFEADSSAPWPRAPPLDHVKVVAVRAAGHES